MMLQTLTSRLPRAAVVHSIPAVSLLARHICKAGYSAINVSSQKGKTQMIQRRDLGCTALVVLAAPSAMCAAAYMALRYKVALPNEWIVKTGPFVPDMEISKRTMIWPFQEHIKINMNPITIKTIVNAMTTEKIPFNMPMTFTICPIEDNDSLKKYAARVCGIDQSAFEENLLGIIQGESRILTASLELEKLFNDRDTFKKHITDNINSSLSEFGLRAMNVNIEELIDNDGSEYFKYMKKKALEKAVNIARIDVAEQTKEGDIGEKEHVRTSRKKLAEIEADAVNTENEKQREMIASTTNLEIAKSNFDKSRQIAAYQAKAEAEMKQIEYQQQVEEKRKQQMIEELRAKDYSASLVAAEVKAKDMEGTTHNKLLFSTHIVAA